MATAAPVVPPGTVSVDISSSKNQASIGLLSNTNAQSQGGNAINNILQQSSHPTAVIFFLAFRTAALLVYLFSSVLFLGDSFMLTVVLTVLLLSLDFWTVKNVSGRLLVGRRWWNSTREIDGATIWTFEARSAPWKANPVDSRIFWYSLYWYSIAWIILGLLAVIRWNFSWLLVVAFAVTLNFTNLIGYIKCDREAQTEAISGWGATLFSGVIGSRLNSLFTSSNK